MSFLLGFVFSVLKEEEESESLLFLKASERQHHVSVIFSLWSYEVTYFLCVYITPFPVSLNPARAGVPVLPLSTLNSHDHQMDTEPGSQRRMTVRVTGTAKA